jgi:pyrroloquinoline quinone biosynthesis protein B
MGRHAVTGLAWIWGVMTILSGSAAAGDAPGPERQEARYELIVLGIAQDGGVPHVGCDKACCREARASGRTLFPASLGIHDKETGALVLVEATPAVEPQLALLQARSGERNRGRAPVDAVLLTHAHIGHYLGLAHFGREVAATDRLPVFVSPRLGDFLRSNGPWSQLVDLNQIVLGEVAPGQPFEPVPGVRVTALPVPHRDEFSDTMAFRIEAGNSRVLFVPDVDAWDRDPGLLERLLDGVTAAFVDATFYDGRELPGRDLSTIPHPLMTDTMDRLAAWGREHPGALAFIHLNHTNPALRDPAIRETITGRGFRVAEQGETLPL